MLCAGVLKAGHHTVFFKHLGCQDFTPLPYGLLPDPIDEAHQLEPLELGSPVHFRTESVREYPEEHGEGCGRPNIIAITGPQVDPLIKLRI